MPEIIEDEKTGYLVEPGQPIALAKSIIKLYESKNQEDVVERSLKLVRSKYDWSVIARNTEKILNDVFERSQ